jgi:hypothetical protein
MSRAIQTAVGMMILWATSSTSDVGIFLEIKCGIDLKLNAWYLLDIGPIMNFQMMLIMEYELEDIRCIDRWMGYSLVW